jgi:hypothetical protein
MSYTALVTNLTVAQVNGQQIGTAASQLNEWHKHNDQSMWGYDDTPDNIVTDYVGNGNSQRLVYYNAAQAFDLTATGLKPNTVHTFTFNNIDVSAFCQPLGGAVGDALTTDSGGQLNFTYYYTNDITTTAPNNQYISASAGILGGAASTVASAQSIINSLTGNKVGTLSNSDGTSTAQVMIVFYSQQTPTPVEQRPLDDGNSDSSSYWD